MRQPRHLVPKPAGPRFLSRFLPAMFAAFWLLPGYLLVGPPHASAQTQARDVPEQVLHILMENRSAPFSHADTRGEAAGFVPDLLRAIAADQGLHIDFDLRPWQEVYPEFLSGKGDILGLVAYTDARSKQMDFSVQLEQLDCSLYIRDGAPEIHSYADLRGKRLTLIKDSIAHEFFKARDWGCVLVPLPSLQEGLEYIQQGRADVAVGMRFVTEYRIRTAAIAHVHATDLTISELGYSLRFAVHPGNKHLLARINEGLANVRANGAYDTLHEKHLGPLRPRTLRWRELQPYVLPLAILLAAVLAVLVMQRQMLLRITRQAEALRLSEERLSLVFKGSRDAFWDWDVAADRLTRSERWCDILGYPPNEIPANNTGFMKLVHPDDQPIVLATERSVWAGLDHFENEFRMRAKGGEWKWVLDRGMVVSRDPLSGNPLRIAGTHSDITARKLSEAEHDRILRKMFETQKLESLGVLASGIAHDFNNLLTVIQGSISIVRDGNAAQPVSGKLDRAAAAAQRASDLCRQLMSYAGKGPVISERINLNSLAKDTTDLLELSSGQARLEFHLQSDLPPIIGDPPLLRQIIMNLVINASEAIGQDTGSIRIATILTNVPEGGLPGARPSGDIPPGDYVCLEIRDTGCGMTPAVIERIFDPFFTTKSTGRGLGLAAVLGIVQSSRGALVVDSVPSLGTTFRVYLPVAPQGFTSHRRAHRQVD